MTEFGLPFDGVSLGDAVNAPYSAAEWAHQWALRHGIGSAFPNYGVFRGTGSGSYEALTVVATNPVSTNVEIQIGAALVYGRLYENTAVVTKAIGANASGNPRIDTVILRVDFVAQTVRLVVLQGTPAASPVRPTLTQDASYWEIPLADIAVANGFATLAQSTITDRRRFVGTLGWLPYAHPLKYVPNGAYSSSQTIVANGGGIAVPFVLGANLLLQQIHLRVNNPLSTLFDLNWGFYAEDTNDGNSSESTVRLVASGQSLNALGADNNVFFTAVASLPLGMYWFVLINSDTSNLTLRTTTPGVFDDYAGYFLRGAGGSITQTLTLTSAAGWSTKPTDLPAIRLQGRVLGETTAF